MLAALLGSGGVISTLFCSSFLPKLQLSQSCDNILIPVKCFSQSTVFNPKSIRGAAGREQEGSVPPRKVCQLHLGVRMGTDCFGLWILSELLPFICFSLLEVTYPPISAALLVKLCCVTIRVGLVPVELWCQVLQSTVISVLGDLDSKCSISVTSVLALS